MREKIKTILSDIEAKHHIKIIYACEAGSRSWGGASADSDYDIRFIYVRPLEWYLSIDQKPDVIELPGNPKLDIVGWDLKKALFLLKKSNPPLLEWLQSKIIYYEHQPTSSELKQLAKTTFSAKTCLFHYLNIAKKNRKGMFMADQIKVKRILNVMKPLLACKWIEQYHQMPPIEMKFMMNEVVIHDQIHKEIEKLITKKQQKVESVSCDEVSTIKSYSLEEIDRLEAVAQSLNPSQINQQEINHFFIRSLKRVWRMDW